ncbi:hypothetical protein NL676_030702 [Syzygium grande]|nr:hypothetical protein NL676_030702 [Syzygium grande]
MPSLHEMDRRGRKQRTRAEVDRARCEWSREDSQGFVSCEGRQVIQFFFAPKQCRTMRFAVVLAMEIIDLKFGRGTKNIKKEKKNINSRIQREDSNAWFEYPNQ